MRKLLVASQKSGVGKTTTSINLAAAAALAGTRVLLLDADPLSSVSSALRLGRNPLRRTLRQSGVDLPGVIVCDVLPGLDVLSPYETGSCSDADLDGLLRLLDAPPMRASYGCLVVDAPPFLGANPGQLVSACDGYLVVMRAEPLAYRTLPAFLELVERSRHDRPVRLHGVLLTLQEGEPPGGRWERELRGRLGGRVLAEAIPHDAEVVEAADKGLLLAQTAPESPAGASYQRLAAALQLAEDPAPLKKTPGAAALAAAAAAVLQPVAAAAGDDVRASLPVEAAESPVETLPDLAPPPEGLGLPSFTNLRVAPPSLTLPAFNPPPAAVTKLQPVPTGPEEEPAAPRPAAAPAPPSGGNLTWVAAVALAAAGGVALRFVPLTDSMLPVAVGVAVSAAVVLVLRLLAAAPEPPSRPVQVLVAPPPARKGKGNDRPEGRRDASARPSGLTRIAPSGSHRRPRKK